VQALRAAVARVRGGAVAPSVAAFQTACADLSTRLAAIA